MYDISLEEYETVLAMRDCAAKGIGWSFRQFSVKDGQESTLWFAWKGVFGYSGSTLREAFNKTQGTEINLAGK